MSDSLAALRSALAPKDGMRRVPFAKQSADLDSLPVTSERLVNLFAEQAPTPARTDIVLASTPGLVSSGSYGPGPIYAMNSELPGRVYFISADHLWRIASDEFGVTYVDMGYVGLPDNTAPGWTIAIGPVYGVVCVSPRAYAFNVNDAFFEQIGGDFPGARSVAYHGGLFVFTAAENSSQFFVSEFLNPTGYDALDFAFSDAVPNVIRRAVSHRGDLWLFGEAGVEVWYLSGDADFPLRPRSGGFIPRPVGSAASVATADGSVFWLGRDYIVFRSEGYNAARISSHAVERRLRDYAGEVSCAVTYSDGGHTFYALTLIKAGDPGMTFVYDAATRLWHERSSAASGAGRWIVQCVASNLPIPLFGTATSGRLFTLAHDGGMDDDVQPPRIAVLPPIWANSFRAFMSRLELEMEVGGPLSPGNILIEWSDDGGHNWTGSRTLNTGTTPEYRKRLTASRLGSFRQRTFRITCRGRVRLYALVCDIAMGVT